MKNTTKQLIAFLFLSVMIGFVSCNSNDDEIQEKELASVTEEFQQKISQMNLPSSLESSEDYYANQTSSSFNLVKGWGEMLSSLLIVPDFASSTSKPEGTASKSAKTVYSKTYTWTSGEQTITYTITEESDKYIFSYNVISSEFVGELISGYQLKDGSYAELTMFSVDGPVVTFKYWVNGNNIKAEIILDEVKYYLEYNSETNEGFIDLYENNILTYKYTWYSNGSGTYKNYTTNETVSW